MVHTFVVSLPRSSRRLTVTAELGGAGIDFAFSDGVLLPLERIEFLLVWLRDRFSEVGDRQDLEEAARSSRLTQGSLGTLLAYLALFQTVIDSGEDVCLVLEDDVKIRQGVQYSRVNWEQLHASYGMPMFLFLHKCQHPFGLVAQLVSRKGALAVMERVTALLRSSRPIDLFVWDHPDITRRSLYPETGEWLFEHASPVNHVPTSERMHINRVYGHDGDCVNK